jgi:PAS domain S-box-containing protein
MSFPFWKLNNLWAKLPARRRGTVVIAIPAACIAVTLAAWIWSRDSIFLAQQRTDRTAAVILESNNLLVELLNAETGVRGYVISQDDRFLIPYTQAAQNVPMELEKLNGLIDDNTPQDDRLQTIAQLAQQRVAVLDQIVRLSQQQATASAISPAVLPEILQGKQVMDQTRTAISELQAAERQRLSDENLSKQAVQNLTNLLLWSSVAVSVVGTWAALYLFKNLDQELKDRERLLRESRSMLQAIATHVVDGVVILDEDRSIELFNPTASRLFGYEPLEVKGKRLDMLFSDSIMQQFADSQKSRFAGGQRWRTMGLRKVGSPFPVEISISDLQVEDRLITIIRDISQFEEVQAKLQARADELVRLTTVLAQTNSTLQDRNRELEQFAYVASHDLKAPLRAIANLSTWIEEDLEGALPPENQYQMQLLRGRVNRMEDLINGLLEYSRIGRSQVAIEQVDVKSLLAEVLESLAPPPTFTIDIPPDLPVFRTRKAPLRQVFFNLMSNAIKHHNRSDGQIRISYQEQTDFYEFAVTDDGVGIAADYHDKIFVIFQTLEARDTKESTGIGLAIVRKIVEGEGGKVWIESAENEGATFFFTWLKQPLHLSAPVSAPVI